MYESGERMELRTLRYFSVVAREKNITKAAQLLNMSQPPLSSQIHNLEEELGVALLIRGKRHLELTPEGELLQLRAQQILDLEEKTCQEIRSMRNNMTGTLCIGLVEGRAPYFAAELISGFLEEFPLVRYNLWNGSGDDVIDRLNKGLADVAIIAAPYDTEHLDSIKLGEEPWVAMIPAGNLLSERSEEEISLSELVGQPLIVPSRKSRIQAIRQWFSEIGAEPSILCETSNYIDAAALVERQVGISIFPQTIQTDSDCFTAKTIIHPSRMAEYFLVWGKENMLPDVVEEFLNFTRDTLHTKP